MNGMRNRQPMTYVLVILVVVLAIGVGYFLWREARTERASFTIGDQTIEVETTRN